MYQKKGLLNRSITATKYPMDSQKKYQPVFSFEFFPPRTEESEALLDVVCIKLARLKPAFFSVTFGAGGSTQELTKETTVRIRERTGIEAAPHLSGIGSSRDKVKEILDDYRALGVKRIVALRGDLPSGTYSPGDFRYANELVEFIHSETGDYFNIEVAAYPEAHPQAVNLEADIENFKRKVDAGVCGAITQYFYNADSYFHFVELCEKRGVDIPIVPGVMPINNFFQLSRFSEACGAEIPRWVRKQLEYYGDDRKSIQAFGLDVVTTMCERLLKNGAPGLHFYTMNQAKAVMAIWDNLNIQSGANNLEVVDTASASIHK